MSTIKTQSGVYQIQNANSMERISDNQKIVFNKLWLYPAKGVAKSGDASGLSPGLLILNGAGIFVGEHMDGADATPDALNINDLPLKIELPQGESKLLRDVLIQGAAGDGVFFKYWPA
jgi:hypothetical protein